MSDKKTDKPATKSAAATAKDASAKPAAPKVESTARKPNITGKSRRPLSQKSAVGGQSGVSLEERLTTAEKFMRAPEKWPRMKDVSGK